MGIFMDNLIYTTEVDKYASFEKKSPNKFTRICIDGRITGRNKCLGYCQYDEHPGFLTADLIKQHNCKEKNCSYFVAKPKKQRLSYETDDFSSEILAHCKNAFDNNEYIKIMGIKNTEYNKFTITYISITKEINFKNYVNLALELFGVEISFVKLNYDFDNCIEILCKK